MTEPLTDQQLIELVQQKTPEELTPEEIERLRTRLRESAALQETLFVQLEMEGYLHAALGEPDFAAAQVLDRMQGPQRDANAGGRRSLIVGLLLLVAAGLFVVATPKGRGWIGLGGDAGPVDGDATAAKNGTETETPHDDGSTKPPTNDSAAVATNDPVTPKTGDPAAPTDPVANPVDPKDRWSVLLEAEAFARGNLEVDRSEFGAGIGIVRTAANDAGFVEFDVTVPAAGLHQLELRYASDESRPLRLEIDKREIRTDAAAAKTGGWGPAQQKGTVLARVELTAGAHVIRLDAKGKFPHVDKLAVVAVPEAVAAVVAKTDALPLLALDRVATAVAVRDPATERPFDPQQPPRPFATAVFDDPADSASTAPTAESFLKRWFEPIEKRPLKIAARPSPRPSASFEGIGRLKTPWPEDVALRAATYGTKSLKLHLWQGETGITLQHYPTSKPSCWVAYLARREGTSPQPKSLTLLTTDGGAFERSGSGVFEVRHGQGEVVVTAGNVRLLSVPMAAGPTDVVLEGAAYFSLLSMYRSEPLPPPAPSMHRVVLRSETPARLAWSQRFRKEANWIETPAQAASDDDGPWSVALDVTKGELKGDAHGRIELDATASEHPPLVSTELPGDALREVLIRVDSADPGTGIYFARADGTPVAKFGCFQNGTTAARVWEFKRLDDWGEQRTKNAETEVAPFLGREQWLRFVPAFGKIDVWYSGDGLHWGRQTGAPTVIEAAAVARIGLFAPAGKGTPKRIALSHLQVRELSAATSLVAAEVLSRVPAEIATATDHGAWFAAMATSRPADVEAEPWRQACALRAVQLESPLSGMLLERLLREKLVAATSPDERIAALEDVLTLAANGPLTSAQTLDLILRFGLSLVEQDDPRPSQRLTELLVRHPIWSDAAYPIPHPLVFKAELIQHVYGERWEQTLEFCRQRRFWLYDAHAERTRSASAVLMTKHCAWGEMAARLRQPAATRGELPIQDASWRHPLAWQLSKEGYNVMAEFSSAVEGRAFDDACRIMSSAGTAGLVGLLPDVRDADLLVSLSRSVALAMREHPELRETMQREFGPLAQVRVRQAIAEGNPAALEAATVQFHGTEAAAEAQRWLGDRALSGGQFGEALVQYRAAMKEAPFAERSGVRARIRLAGALMGRTLGEPVTESVRLGDSTMTATEFEALVAELVRARAGSPEHFAGSDTAAAASLVPPAPARTQQEVALRGELDGDWGRSAGNNFRYDKQWGPRQLGVVADGARFYVGNRFQVAAFDATDGRKLWANGLGAKDQGEDGHWPCTSMTPLLLPDRVVSRRIATRGTELVCLGREKGDVLWQATTDGQIVSDPLFARGRILAVTTGPAELDILSLNLTAWNPDRGDVASQEPLLRVRDVWQGRPPCGIAAAEGKLLLSVAGSVACCDFEGRLQWLRRQTWLPPDLDVERYQVHVQPPLVDGDRVFVTEPSTRSVVALELESGRLVWTRGMADVRRIVGVADGKLIVQTLAGLTACDAATGRRAWTLPFADLHDAVACGGPHGLLVVDRMQDVPNKFFPRMNWIDAGTGALVAALPLPSLLDADPQLGPFVRAGDKLWTFRFLGPQDVKPDLVELKPLPTASAGPVVSAELRNWLPQGDLRLQTDVERVFPGWAMTTVLAGADVARVPELQGEKDLLQTSTLHGTTIRFVRTVAVTASGPRTLRLKFVGAGTPWRLQATIDGTVAVDRTVGEKPGPQSWETADVDLKPFAGRTVQIVVSHGIPANGPGGKVHWKSLDLVP